MADLIDRDKLIDYIMESDPDWCVKPVRPIFDFISGMPPVDAVKIVRCKNCKFYEGGWYCSAWNNSPGFPMVTEEGYCNLAERRTDG